ncbi:hypothetical protein TWF281_011818 [Arthrobotrys megalospora]
MYPENLVIDEDESDQRDDYLHPTHYPYPPQTNYHPAPYSDTSGPSSSGFWSSPNNTRGISSMTSPDEEYPPAPSGQRCIFHWIDCRVRRDNHDDWVEHIYYDHFKPLEYSSRHSRPDFGRTPTSWTCMFRDCRTVMRNDDHQALWDEKLAHIYGHLTRDRGKPEDIQEDPTWMKYYEKMGFCHAYDIYGSQHAPPPMAPFVQGVIAWKKMPRKVKQRSRGHSHQDASGEPMHPIPNQEPTAGVQMAPSPHYGHPQPMDMGAYPQPDPNQYHYGHPGPGGQPGHIGHPGPISYPGPVGY